MRIVPDAALTLLTLLPANPIPIKWAAKRMGMIDNAYMRPPLDELSPVFHTLVEDALGAAGLLAGP